MAVTGLMVLDGDEKVPDGWVKDPTDLNMGAGGDFLYFASQKDGKGSPVTDIQFIQVKEGAALPPAPAGYEKIDVDLNKGVKEAGREVIYACYTRDPLRGDPVEDIKVGVEDDRPEGYFKIPVDLNKGAGGKYIYLFYKVGRDGMAKVPQKSRVTDLNVVVGQVQPAPDGWTLASTDLNAGAGGEYLYFAFEKDGEQEPLTDIAFRVAERGADRPKPVDKYTTIPVDLNLGTSGSGSKVIYACITRATEKGKAIEDLMVISSDSKNPDAPPGYRLIPQDLNEGAGGKFVYLARKDA